ncbi:type II toxin-antitoxin system VapC family toxin [Haladaptatus sp. DFWS20]|uniref:type II toxin-antitoxin system VapC family toxin n=1 Tax=Haladaptatus sp. DFWS20 TaxID=3403467 RepID=UPI003EBA076A
MSVLIDTGVFYAHHDEDAERHYTAVSAMNTVLSGEYGQPYTSDYVYDETVTLTRMRTGSFTAAKTVSDRILGRESFPEIFEIIQMGHDDFKATVDTWIQYQDHDLSVTDASLVTLCERYDIDTLLSFDSDFDGIVHRTDPSHMSTE